MENFKLTRSCTKDELVCKNSYGHNICVDKNVERVACAEYFTSLCEDDKYYFETYEWFGLVVKYYIIIYYLIAFFS